MSSTIAAVAGTNNSGLGTERHIIWAVNSGNWWAFGYTSTSTLACWYSSDGSTWTAGTTHTLSHAHNSEGRNLSVGYKSIGGVDVVHISLPYKTGTNIGWSVIRATISSTTITYHSSETNLNTGTSDLDSLFWAGTTVEFDTNNKVHIGGGWIDNASDGAMTEQTSSADAGSAEQMTAVTWTAHDIDSSEPTETRSGYMVDLGSGTTGYMADDGSSASTTTGIEWATWPGSGAYNPGSGLGNVDVTGSLSAFDRNDWGAVGARTADIHVVVRTGSNTYLHRRFDGTSWSTGQIIPTQNSLAGGGIALCSDGASVWLCVIDTDSANTVRNIQWIPQDHSGVPDAWGSWQPVETSTQTRTWIGCVQAVANQTGLIYWSEGSNLVAATFTGISPADPPYVQSKLGFTTSASSLATQFDNNVVQGNRIIVMVGLGNNVGSTLSSISDSGSNTYNADATALGQNNAYMRSAPIVGGGGTRVTVTVNITGGPDAITVWIAEYNGLSSAANAVDASGTAIPGGAATLHTVTTSGNATQPNEIAVFYNHDDGSGGSQTAGNGITLHGTDSANTFTTSFGDKFATQGATTTGSVTTANSVFYTAIIVVYKMAPVAGATYPIRPGPVWQRQFARGALHPAPRAAPGSTVQNLQQALTAGLSFTGGGPIRAISKGLAAAALSFTGSQVRAVAKGVTAGLSFAGSISRSTSHLFTAALSFTGSGPVRALGKLVSGGLSFTGAQARSMTKLLSAAGLSFTGAITKAITKGAFLATLSFTGLLVSGKQFLRSLTAGLSFTGAQSRQIGKALSGTLSFTGSGPIRAIVKGLTASLAFTGAQSRATAKKLAAASMSFAGSVASSHVFLKALTATLSFTGSQARSIGKGLSAALSFTGSLNRALAKLLAAAGLSFAAVLQAVKTSGQTVQPIALLIVTRSMSVMAGTRDLASSMVTRSMSVAVRTRDMVTQLITRSGNTRSR